VKRTGREDPPSIEALSPRRREVLHLVARGLTNDEIASALGIAVGTVRTHLGAILAALDVTNRTEAAVAYQAWDARPPRLEEILVRPALAVLPIQTVDGRGRAEAAGLTRDLVASFSRWCGFPVIANAATASARELGGVEVISRTLGARFLLDAMLRVSADAWRLNVELVDAEAGCCLASEVHDFTPDGLFAAQDRLCDAVVAATYERLIGALARPAPARHPEVLAAWELAHRGLNLQASREEQANHGARARLQAALAQEPTLVLGHFGLGLTAYDAVLNQWRDRGEALDELAAAGERCATLAPHLAEGWYLQARHHQALGRHDRAVASLRIAIANNPSFAAAHALLGQVLLLAGEQHEGLARMRHACRLGPRAYVAGLAVAYFIRSEYALALATAEQAIATNPRYPFVRALAVASAWYLGRTAVAWAHAAELRRMHHGFTSARFLDTFGGEHDAVARIAHALAAVALV